MSLTGKTIGQLPTLTSPLDSNALFVTEYGGTTYSLPYWQNYGVVTGFSFNTNNYDLTLTGDKGLTLTQSLAILSSDMTIVSGSYNPTNGVATFINNSGGTFNVTGFLTGYTDFVVSGLTYNNLTGTLTLSQTNGSVLTTSGFLTGTTTDFFVTGGTYSNGTLTLNRQNGSLTVSGFLTGTTTDFFVTGGTYSNGTLTLRRQNGSLTVSGFLTTNTFTTGFTYSNNNLTISRNQGQPPLSVNISLMTGLTINGNLNVTGNTSVRRLVGTTALFSANSQTVLTVIGSGSSTSSPLFRVQGSQGELFSINDSLIGSLFSVNDISGLPILEVFSNNTILMGNYVSPSLNTTVKKTSLSGASTTIYSIPISAYTGAFFDYTAANGTNVKSGSIISVWNSTTSNFTETSTSVGTTSGITFSVNVSGGSASLVSSATTNNWTVKTIVRSI